MTSAGQPLREPVDWRPGPIWSLWDLMQTFKVAETFDAFDLVVRLRGRIENKREVENVIARDDHGDDFPQIKASMKALVERFSELNLRLPLKQAAHLLSLAEKGATYRTLEKEIEFLQRTVVNHFEERMVLLVDERKTHAYKDASSLFGFDVWAKFPSSERDMDEAGKCLALGRNTACVFHLMRAMEAALRALANKIGATIQDYSGQFCAWGVIVANIKDKLPGLPPEWTEAHNLLWGVGKAWRNTTMHPAEAYTDAETETVFDAVRGFMRHLAPLV